MTYPRSTLLWVIIMFLITSCNEESPSFVEERTSRKVNVTVGLEGDAEGQHTADSVTSHAQTLDDDEISNILGGLGGEDGAWGDDGGSSSDATASGSTGDGADGSSSGDGSTSSGPTGDSGSDGSTSGDGGAVSGSDGGTSTITGDEDTPTQGELNACAKLNGVTTSEVKVISGEGDLDIGSGAILAAKVGGDMGEFTLNLAGGGDVAALCLFNTGNGGKIFITLGVHLGNLIYGGRGDQSLGDIHVASSGSVDQIIADLNGNQSLLNVYGDGTIDCNGAIITNKAEYFSCE